MNNSIKIEELKNISSQVRRDIVRMVHKVQSGHPGGSLGCTDFFVSLFFHVMKKNSSFKMDGINEDIFFLSNGHISPVFYSVLARSGYFDVKELDSFRKLNSRLQGHPATHEKLPGIRIASGSLGQGLSVAIGSAISKKLNNDKNIVYVLLGDGELQEGQVWEALMFAAHNKVDNLESFGWIVIESDGNDFNSILNVMNEAKKKLNNGYPVINIMKTIMGKGVNFMENSHKWHGIPPNDEQLSEALSQLEETLGDY